MRLTRHHIHRLTRDPAFVFRVIAMVLAVFAVTGVLVSPGNTSGGARAFLEKQIAAQPAAPDNAYGILQSLREASEREEEDGTVSLTEALRSDIALSPLPDPQKAILREAAGLFLEKPSAVPPAAIASLAARSLPDAPALPGTIAGDLLRRQQKYSEALAAYRAAAALPDGAEAARRAVTLLVRLDDPAALQEFAAQPAVAAALDGPGIDPGLSERVALLTRDYGALLSSLAYRVLNSWRSWDWLTLSLLSGGVWFVSIHAACGLPPRRWWIGLLGVFLGALSVVPTIFFNSIQASRGGLDMTGDAGNDLVFYIASVGLREEFCKLLLFLPLLILLRRGTFAQALAAASSVGLGFAVEENIGYYHQSAGIAVWDRLLMANFLHIALTGLTGLALFKAARYPRTFSTGALGTFLAAVLLHGLYNYSLAMPIPVPGMENERGTAALFLIIALAYYYFQSVRTHSDRHPQPAAPHAVFMIGSAVVLGAIFSLISLRMGWSAAIDLTVPSVLSSAILSALFFYQLRENPSV